MEISPGLHRIGDDLVACYLAVDGGQATLLDAGLPGYRRPLRALLSRLGMTESDIAAVILTHGDSDHVGFSGALARDCGTPVYLHAADIALARGQESFPNADRTAWTPTGAAQFLGKALINLRPRTQLSNITSLVDGDELDLPGRPRIVGLPGHTPGSCGIELREYGAVAVGDALTTRHILTRQRKPLPAPFTHRPQQALDSLDRLTALDVDTILPGHGPIWTGKPELLVDQIRETGTAAGTVHVA